MKKFRFALLALIVAAITFAFTPKPLSLKAPAATVYAFAPNGTFLGSAPNIAAVKSALCPGANDVVCAEVWSSKTVENEPAGIFLGTVKRPSSYRLIF